MRLEERIADVTARVGVVGLGDVALTEALALTRAGYPVTGFDVAGPEVTGATEPDGGALTGGLDEELLWAVRSWSLRLTGDVHELRDMDVILVCVPTPPGTRSAPGMSHIRAATEAIGAHLRPGQLVVLETTCYPGTTTGLVLPALERTGLRGGHDFHLCFSPECASAEDKEHSDLPVPRVVGGVTPACTGLATALFARIGSAVIAVSSPQAAEMVKLLENTFQAVNLGLANEIALLCRTLRIDVWEVIDAAASKPFGFMPFYPGPGWGGDGIRRETGPVSGQARLEAFGPRFAELAQQVNGAMPAFVVSLLADALSDRGRSLSGARVLVLGVTDQRDARDIRESPALVIIADLIRRGATVRYHDPYVPTLTVGDRALRSVPLDDRVLQEADSALILTDHSAVDYRRVVEAAPLVVDTRNATAGAGGPLRTVVRL